MKIVLGLSAISNRNLPPFQGGSRGPLFPGLKPPG
jgi:hypothetical protein